MLAPAEELCEEGPEPRTEGEVSFPGIPEPGRRARPGFGARREEFAAVVPFDEDPDGEADEDGDSVELCAPLEPPVSA